MWISDYNDELTEYMMNERLYVVFKNMIFFVENTLKRYYEYTGFINLLFKNIYYQKYFEKIKSFRNEENMLGGC
jgi:hypothetical protein